jgi:hypothetical protein
MIDRMTIAAVARELGLSWDTVNTIAMDATQMIVAADNTRLDGVRVIGVDEHRWSHTRHTDGFVTVIIDLTPVLDGTGRARLLDLATAVMDVVGERPFAIRPRSGIPESHRADDFSRERAHASQRFRGLCPDGTRYLRGTRLVVQSLCGLGLVGRGPL